jgi:hypothetical protein
VRADRGGGQVLLLEQAEHGVEPVQAAGIEGGADEAAPILRIGDAHLAGDQRAEVGEPARHHRPRGEAGRRVHEGRALAGHGVLVAPGQVEGRVGRGPELHRRGHEGMVAVDGRPRPLGATKGGHLRQAFEGASGLEEDLAEEDQVEVAAGRALEEAGLEVLDVGGDGLQRNLAGLDPTGGLAAKGVELGVGGEHPHRLARPGGD